MMSVQEGGVDSFFLKWPLDAPTEESVFSAAVLIMKREGGVLLAVPTAMISPEELQQASASEGDGLLGPNTLLTVPAVFSGVEDQPLAGQDIDVQVIDFSLDVLGGLFPADATLPEGAVLQHFGDDPSIMPDLMALLGYTREWLTVLNAGRPAFYSATEEVADGGALPAQASPKVAKAKAPKTKAVEKAKRASPQLVAEQIKGLSDLLPNIAKTLAEVQQEQHRLREMVEGNAMNPAPRPTQAPVSMSMQRFSKIMGAPPRVKGLSYLQSPPPKATAQVPALDASLTMQEQAEEGHVGLPEASGNSLALAVLEQSRALTSLVSHLQTGGDPLLDQPVTGSSMSSKGAQGRERLQRELALRSGQFCLAVAQNAYRRMKPASRLPETLEDIANTDFSMLSYLERFGGYGNTKEVGLMQYGLSFILDAAIRGDLEGVREHAALMTVGLEQVAQDQGRWDLGFQLMLLEDPPSQMWTFRNAGVAHTGRTRAFAALCPQKWATIALAYTKELDYIQSRRTDLTKPTTPAPAQPAPASPPKKKGGKGKGKGGAGGGTQQSDGQDQV